MKYNDMEFMMNDIGIQRREGHSRSPVSVGSFFGMRANCDESRQVPEGVHRGGPSVKEMHTFNLGLMHALRAKALMN